MNENGFGSFSEVSEQVPPPHSAPPTPPQNPYPDPAPFAPQPPKCFFFIISRPIRAARDWTNQIETVYIFKVVIITVVHYLPPIVFFFGGGGGMVAWTCPKSLMISHIYVGGGGGRKFMSSFSRSISSSIFFMEGN